MAEAEHPQLYLVTPAEFELSRFPVELERVLGEVEVACLRLALSTRDEDTLMKAADAVRDVAYRADVALVIDTHVVLAERLGLDGVHLTDGARSVRSARKTLGADAIVGAYCAQSRHEGMNAGEAGADYVAFGPCGVTTLGDGAQAEHALFEWWSQMIEVPVVAEGALSFDLVRQLAPVTDFFCLGDEVWRSDDPLQALKDYSAATSG